MLSVHYDEEAGIVITTAQGLTSAQDFDDYLPILMGLFGRSAARHGAWFHIVDASANPVQARDSTDHVAAMWKSRPRDDGYTACIVGSVLARMQIQRMRDYANRAFFTEMAPAREWLLRQSAEHCTPLQGVGR